MINLRRIFLREYYSKIRRIVGYVTDFWVVLSEKKTSKFVKLFIYSSLMTGETNSDTITLNTRDERDIAKRLENTLSVLDTQESLMFSGEPLDDATRELLKVSIENSLRIAKVNTKQKFTPKKYRNNNK